MPLLVTILKLPLPIEMDCCIRLVANVVELELNPIFKFTTVRLKIIAILVSCLYYKGFVLM